jgi:hypothetical protein
MFEDYIEDAYAFVESGRSALSDREAARMYRAAILQTSAAVEAYVNYIADTLSFAKFEAFEIAFLSDKSFGLTNEYRFVALNKVEYHRIDDKIRLLIAKFGIEFEFGSEQTWSHFLALKNQRDALIHPRHVDETLTRADFDALLKRGLTAVLDLMNRLSIGIFSKPLRTGLLELKP